MSDFPARITKKDIAVDPPKGSPDRLNPYILTSVKGIKFQGIIPPGHGHPRYKLQGRSIDEVKQAICDRLDQIYKHGSGVIVFLSAQDEKDAQEARRKLIDMGLGEVALSALFGCGLRYWQAVADLKLGDRQDPLDLAYEMARLKVTTLGQAVAKFVCSIPKPKKAPLTDGNTQAASIEGLLTPLIETFGADTPFYDVVMNSEGLKAYAEKWLQGEEGTMSTRCKRWATTLRLFRVICPHLGCPNPMDTLFGFRPEGLAESISAISPEAIDRVLNYQARKRPDMLLYTLLQVFCGLRPEEAYRFLAMARQYTIGSSHVFLPAEITKTHLPRIIRLRPAFLAWLAKVPGWADPNFDLTPRNRDGVPIKPQGLQATLNNHLRRIGRWKGKIPKESLRKSWASACITLGIPIKKRLKEEAGHTDIFVLGKHYDAKWAPELGIALFSIFPEQPNPVPSEWDLYHAYGQIGGERDEA